MSGGKGTKFQTPSAGRWVLQRTKAINHLYYAGVCFKPHQRGGGCCSAENETAVVLTVTRFQTPSAGRWVLQRCGQVLQGRNRPRVSNPISGEVGAAASRRLMVRPLQPSSFKPHQRGGGCCSAIAMPEELKILDMFQTPSAGRWVLQPSLPTRRSTACPWFQTPSAGRWVLQLEAEQKAIKAYLAFQTPSAGRWVLQPEDAEEGFAVDPWVSNPISGEVGAAVCRPFLPCPQPRHVSNPISGEVGAAARVGKPRPRPAHQVSNPISGEVGAAAREHGEDLQEG